MKDEVTVIMPTYNAAATLKVCLEKLQLQRIPNLKVFIMDNGSVDGTRGMLGELVATKFFANNPAIDKYALDLYYFQGEHDNSKTPYENGQETRKKLSKLVTTKYVFLLDPDVLLPPYAIVQAIDEFKKRENTAYITIRYEPDEAHHMLGATLWETKTFQEVPTYSQREMKGNCDCNFCKAQVEKKGLIPYYHPTLMAAHCKHF
jgi:glycosyltransferase involved in cell wall biosynthesis